MRYISLFLLFILMMSVACQPQKPTVETQPNFNEQNKQNSAGNFDNRNLAKTNEGKSNSFAPKPTKSGQVFENECYSFDAGGLKPNTDKKPFQYSCESAFKLDDNSGYFPTLAVREYTYEQSGSDKNFYFDKEFNLTDAVRREITRAEKAGYTVKTYSISLGGVSAERIDLTFTCPDNQTVSQDSDNPQSRNSTDEQTTRCKPGSTEKAYAIIADPPEKTSDPGKNRKIPGFYLGGRLNQPSQEIILQQIIKSWRWK